MYSAKILLDSIAPSGSRLTTWELTYPRFIHAEFMTHRVFSRNAASSRAIPLAKLIERVLQDPAMPLRWGKNQPGMQAKEELAPHEMELAKGDWLAARDAAVVWAESMAGVGLHKQIANRILEPWMFITVIASATEYDNFFALRCHPDAQPEFQWIAREMKRLYDASEPRQLQGGEWYIPMLRQEDYEGPGFTTDQLCRIGIGRCARVSYLTHNGKRDPFEDLGLCDRLIKAGHMSPTEHVAMAMNSNDWLGNFRGWKQYRKFIPNEAVFVP